jgi:hypothetical protein
VNLRRVPDSAAILQRPLRKREGCFLLHLS